MTRCPSANREQMQALVSSMWGVISGAVAGRAASTP